MYEELLAAFAAQLVDLPPAEWDERMAPMLRSLSESLNAERSRVELGPQAAQVFPCGGSWRSDSHEGDRDLSNRAWIMRSLPDLPWIADQLATVRVLSIPEVAKLPPEASSTFEYLQELGVDSIILVPLVAHGSLVGVLGLEGVRCEPAREQALRAVADMFVGALERVVAEESLRISDPQVGVTGRLEVLGELAGGVAHDLNSILTAIIGNCDLLAQDILEPSDAASEELLEIRSAAEFAIDLVERILSFGRSRATEARSVDLNWVIVQSTGLLASLIGRGVEVIPDLQEGLGQVRADPAQLEQVIVNLAINARDAMPSGGELRIRARNVEIDESTARYTGRELTPGSYLELLVVDQGCGMDADTRARAFDPFFTTKTLGRGTGLGLSTVAKIVSEMGGVIAIESEIGIGTTIRVLFPREPVSGVTRPRAATGETSLVVDSNPLVRQLLRWALESEGLRVLEARSESDAEQQLSAFGPLVDYLVTDLGLLRRTGHRLSLRLSARQPHLRTLYVADHPEHLIREEGLLGDDAVVVERPLVQLDLIQALQRLRTAGKKRVAVDPSWDVISSPSLRAAALPTARGSNRPPGTDAGIQSESTPSPRTSQPSIAPGSG